MRTPSAALAAAFSLVAAAALGCGGAAPAKDTPYLTVFVAADGVLQLNGREASLIELEDALTAASSRGAVVLFAREPKERGGAAYAMQVLQTIRSRKVSLRLCNERDFSDAIGPDGRLR